MNYWFFDINFFEMGNKICCEETRVNNTLDEEDKKVSGENVQIQPVE